MHLDRRLRMRRDICVHSLEQRDLVGMRTDVLDQFTVVNSGFTTWRELERRSHELRSSPAPVVEGLAGVGDQLRFVVVHVQVTWSARHAQKDDPLGTWREMGVTRCEWIVLQRIP